MAFLRQSSFSGGELAPELWSNSEADIYKRGARSLRNFLPIRQGAAMSRPGTDYLGAVKGGDVASQTSTKVRLIPFIYSSTDTVQNYVLEFGVNYIRFWNNGGLVLSGGVPYEVATTYNAAELPYIRWAQSGDVLTLCHPLHPPAELKRTSNTSWTLSDISFSRVAPAVDPIVLRPAVTAGLEDSSHPAKEWTWQVSEIHRDIRGQVYETAARTVRWSVDVRPYSSTTTYSAGGGATYEGDYYRSLQSANTGHALTDAAWWAKENNPSVVTGLTSVSKTAVLYPDKPLTLLLTYGGTLSDSLVTLRIYRGRGGVYGWVGDSVGPLWTDGGDDPDFSVCPPKGESPFITYDPINVTNHIEYPGAVCFFESRRVFARTDERPASIFASATEDYSNFDTRVVQVADESITFELAARHREEIRSLVGAEMLVAFTNSSVWAIGGTQEGPLTFDNIDAKTHSTVGASWLEPLQLDRTLLYVQSIGTGVRSLTYGVQRNLYRLGYVSEDISLVAQHLFRGHSVVDWAYSQFPWSVAWLVRDDGALVSLTHDHESGIAAWAHHDTDGVVESVCSIPEGGEHAVYMVVRRTVQNATVRYMERLHSRVLTLGTDGKLDTKQAFALDCALTYSGAATTSVSGLSHLEGRTVSAVADGAVISGLTVSGGVVNLGIPSDSGATVVHVGLPFTPEIETLDYAQPGAEMRARQKTITSVDFEVVDSRGASVGQDFDHLTENEQRQVSDSYGTPAYARALYRVPILGTYGDACRAVLRQTDPLPITVTGITLEVDFGG